MCNFNSRSSHSSEGEILTNHGEQSTSYSSGCDCAKNGQSKNAAAVLPRCPMEEGIYFGGSHVGGGKGGRECR